MMVRLFVVIMMLGGFGQILGMLPQQNYYEILGVEKNTGPSEIKTAYHQLSRKWHSDKWVGASDEEKHTADENFKAAKNAYEVLSNENYRKIYDKFGPDRVAKFQQSLLKQKTLIQEEIDRLDSKIQESEKQINLASEEQKTAIQQSLTQLQHLRDSAQLKLKNLEATLYNQFLTGQQQPQQPQQKLADFKKENFQRQGNFGRNVINSHALRFLTSPEMFKDLLKKFVSLFSDDLDNYRTIINNPSIPPLYEIVSRIEKQIKNPLADGEFDSLQQKIILLLLFGANPFAQFKYKDSDESKPEITYPPLMSYIQTRSPAIFRSISSTLYELLTGLKELDETLPRAFNNEIINQYAAYFVNNQTTVENKSNALHWLVLGDHGAALDNLTKSQDKKVLENQDIKLLENIAHLINQVTNAGYTPLLLAVDTAKAPLRKEDSSWRALCIKSLISLGADIFFEKPAEKPSDPKITVFSLLGKNWVGTSDEQKQAKTVILDAIKTQLENAVKSGNQEFINKYFNAEALSTDNPFLLTINKIPSLLTTAVSKKNMAMVKFLLKKGASPFSYDYDKSKTPFQIALDRNNKEIIKALLKASSKHGAISQDDVKSLSQDVDHLSSNENRLATLVNYVNNNIDDYPIIQNFMATGLIREIFIMALFAQPNLSTDSPLAKKLLTDDIEFIKTYRLTSGKTLLHVAAQNNQLNWAKWFIDHGVDKDVQDVDGNTALHDAAGANTYNVNTSKLITYLLEAGCNPEIKNKAKQTPAEYTYSQEIKKLFGDHMAKQSKEKDKKEKEAQALKDMLTGTNQWGDLEGHLIFLNLKLDDFKTAYNNFKKNYVHSPFDKELGELLFRLCYEIQEPKYSSAFQDLLKKYEEIVTYLVNEAKEDVSVADEHGTTPLSQFIDIAIILTSAVSENKPFDKDNLETYTRIIDLLTNDNTINKKAYNRTLLDNLLLTLRTRQPGQQKYKEENFNAALGKQLVRLMLHLQDKGAQFGSDKRDYYFGNKTPQEKFEELKAKFLPSELATKLDGLRKKLSALKDKLDGLKSSLALLKGKLRR